MISRRGFLASTGGLALWRTVPALAPSAHGANVGADEAQKIAAAIPQNPIIE